MADIQVSEVDFSPVLYYGDFNLIEDKTAHLQRAAMLFWHFKGDLRHAPLSGIGIRGHLEAPIYDAELKREIRSQMSEHGLTDVKYDIPYLK